MTSIDKTEEVDYFSNNLKHSKNSKLSKDINP